jgi:hypothetical protein
LRKTATKAIKVHPGDSVVVRAALPSDSGLARLYVWAKEDGTDTFSPYVQGIDAVELDGRPTMLKPMSMRLVSHRPQHKISFVADMKGQIVIVQEVDTFEDKVAEVSIDLVMATKSKLSRFKRRLTEWPTTVRL